MNYEIYPQSDESSLLTSGDDKSASGVLGELAHALRLTATGALLPSSLMATGSRTC